MIGVSPKAQIGFYTILGHIMANARIFSMELW